MLTVHPSLSNDLKIGVFSTLNRLQFKYFLRINLEESENINPQEFEVKSSKNNEKLS